MFQLLAQAAPSHSVGSVEFDDRGNARWVAPADACTEEAVMRLLEVDWLQIVDDEAA